MDHSWIEFLIKVQRRKTKDRLLIKSSSAAVMASWDICIPQSIYIDSARGYKVHV